MNTLPLVDDDAVSTCGRESALAPTSGSVLVSLAAKGIAPPGGGWAGAGMREERDEDDDGDGADRAVAGGLEDSVGGQHGIDGDEREMGRRAAGREREQREEIEMQIRHMQHPRC